jgi:hypothetical protein
MNWTYNDDLCSGLVPLACEFAIDTKLCVGFHTMPNALARPNIVGESPEISLSGTAFAGVELVGHSPSVDSGGLKFVMGRCFGSKQIVATRVVRQTMP